jgi:heme-degrading monooxygenase HmoA
MGIVTTPEPPYAAVIFTSVRTGAESDDGYAEMARRMEDLVADQPGYLGHESARDDIGITVSYWSSADDAHAWKQVADHLAAQRLGRSRWYADYRVRIATVDREYGHADGGAT